MPELPAGKRHCWFRLRFPGDCRDSQQHFGSYTESFDSSKRRRGEHASGRVHPPVAAEEGDGAWAVCVDPV